ncbi:MAG: type II secretion system GspH family protein [Acetobacter sp.]|nr:type II secretion system GspH family protein [Acetobacter sp.]
MQNQTGRSMIEMLGVLAIIGVLSVGGIAGFSKAMRQYKMLQLVDEYRLFIQDYLRYNDDLKRVEKWADIPKILQNAQLLPKDWYIGGGYVYDSMGNRNQLFMRGGVRPVIDFWFKNDGDIDAKKELCQKMFVDVALVYQDLLYAVWVYRGEEAGNVGQAWGSAHCTNNRMCLRDMKLSDILNFCASCIDDTRCKLVFEFNS